jgi:Holliday junction resolvase RusA-like endonuclease
MSEMGLAVYHMHLLEGGVIRRVEGTQEDCASKWCQADFKSRPKRIEFDVDGTPVPKGSKTAFVVGGRAVLTDGRRAGARAASKSWREAVAEAARGWLERNGRPAPIDAPIEVNLQFRLARPASAPKRVTRPAKKPDLDKLCRHALDSLTGLVYADDARIVRLVASKRFAEGEPPGVRVTIEEMR